MEEIRKRVWNGKIPLQITCASNPSSLPIFVFIIELMVDFIF